MLHYKGSSSILAFLNKYKKSAADAYATTFERTLTLL